MDDFQQLKGFCIVEFTASFSHTQMTAPNAHQRPAIHLGIYSAN